MFGEEMIEGTSKIRPEDRKEKRDPGQLLSQESLNYISAKKEEHKVLTNDILRNRFFKSHAQDSNSPLEFPVWIGKKGETIIVNDKELLGQGAYGEVFLGMNLESGKLLAIKYQKPKSATDKIVVEQEEFVLNALGRLIDTFSENGLSISAQEYIQGQNLRDYKNQETTNLEKCDIAIQLLERLDELHNKEFSDEKGKQRKGFVHRDVKPDNALWDGKTLKLIDFGETRALDENGKFVTKIGGGTLYTLPPELMFSFGSCVYSPSTDMYSAGVVIAELFTAAKNLGMNDKDQMVHFRDMDELITNIAQQKTSNARAIPPMLKHKAADILGDVPSICPIQNKLRECIKRMIDVRAENRPTFREAIAELRDIRLEFANAHKVSIMKEKGRENSDDSLQTDVIGLRKSMNELSSTIESKQQAPIIKKLRDISMSLKALAEHIQRAQKKSLQRNGTQESKHQQSRRNALALTQELLSMIDKDLKKSLIGSQELFDMHSTIANMRKQLYLPSSSLTRTGSSHKLEAILTKTQRKLGKELLTMPQNDSGSNLIEKDEFNNQRTAIRV